MAGARWMGRWCMPDTYTQLLDACHKAAPSGICTTAGPHNRAGTSEPKTALLLSEAEAEAGSAWPAISARM